MSKLRRYYNRHDICFITIVTYKRLPILLDNTDIFWKSVDKIKGKTSFELVAWVLLPDYLHLIIEPEGNDMSRLIQRFKMSFGELFRRREGMKNGRVWQNRFWDHVIRNQVDMNNHIDYIHYNPVKHGLTNDPFTWEHSSLNNYFKDGYYQRDWGVKEELVFAGDFGE